MKTYKLKDLLSIENGKDYKSQGKGNVPVYGSGGIMLYIDNYLYDGESILLPRKGTLDNISYVNGKFWTIDTMYWTKVNKEVAYPKYLYYYLSLLDLSGRDSGSTLPSMTFNAYYTLDIELPELSVQKQIADSISLLDDKIKNNNKINAKLEELTKTIYDYWFLQFDFPNENGKPYKTSGGKMTYSNELKREIPEGWRVESLIKNSISKPVKNGIDKFVGKKNYLATADINNEDIEEFPDSIGRPCDRLSFVDGVLKEATREKLISENRYDKYVPWQERRDFANSLHIKKVGNKINNNTNELIKSISTRSADFNDMTADEKLEALNNAIENLIFVDGKPASIDESEFFGLATNDQIKKYRKTTQPFRHAKKQMLEKRNAFSR